MFDDLDTTIGCGLMMIFGLGCLIGAVLLSIGYYLYNHVTIIWS